ncbi:MAG TPA: hypothetical protein VLW47_00205 [Thermodesulfobacteriota bacterium]|nr:hypothetical protein [Thermodesulfobacteriota bacterium]
MAGGGVRGEGTGIAHGATTQVGSIIKAFHLFTEEYLRAGGITTGTIAGKGIHGTTIEYLTDKLNGTGAVGKRAGTGKSNKRGASMA